MRLSSLLKNSVSFRGRHRRPRNLPLKAEISRGLRPLEMTDLGVFQQRVMASLAMTLLVFSLCAAKSAPVETAKYIPIQHSGQVKSFDAFSRQTVTLIAGKETWNGKSSLSLLLETLSNQDAAGDTPWIKISYEELIVQLGLSENRNYFSYNEILPSAEKIEALVRSSQSKRDRDIRPSMLEQKAESLFTAMMEVKHLLSGESITVIPPVEGDAWASPYRSLGPMAAQFRQIIKLFGEGKYADFELKTKEWASQIHQATRDQYRRKINLEVLYLNLRPFEWAWIAYLAAFLLLSALKRFPFCRAAGIGALALAMAFHTLGLVLRVVILSRPPVSNMYESMVCMNWVLMATAIIFSVVKKNTTAAAVGSLISAIIMIYGNLLPIDSSLEVLVPVLRSNYWLTIHVMTIVSSYGIFGLAMGLGHRHLILELRGKLSKEEEARSAQLIYRVIQIGVLLIGIGTTLGGVWANESWGRFWGWDPKETWALITFLGYLIVIHLRLTNKLKPFALALCSILGFLLVLMTWYGVNFVLGRGLHSYGQGSGGMMWVIYYLIFEALFVGYVILAKARIKVKLDPR